MKYQILFSLKNNEKVFINVACCSLIGTLRINVYITFILFIVHVGGCMM